MKKVILSQYLPPPHCLPERQIRLNPVQIRQCADCLESKNVDKSKVAFKDVKRQKLLSVSDGSDVRFMTSRWSLERNIH
jgi:hypothetical protein